LIQDAVMGTKPKLFLVPFVSLFVSVVISLAGQTADVPVRIETSLGNIDLAIDVTHAPLTAANFLRYVDGGFYDGGEFYRAARPDTYHAVLPNRPPMELIEARIPSGKQAYPPIPLERTTVTGLKHVTGVVAMGRNDDQPDSATNDFYILLNDQPSLDMGGKRFTDGQGTAAFGRVVAGLDVARRIQQLSVAAREATPDNPLTKTQNLTPPVVITRVYRIHQPTAWTFDVQPGVGRAGRPQGQVDVNVWVVRVARFRGLASCGERQRRWGFRGARQAPGDSPTSFLNARLNAASDS
jgi:peptidyl-prolyl cis-trans isomerase A (cyclophilin A)